MKISDRYYFDYNATSPVSPEVVSWLCGGDLLLGNPSSVHATGKRSKRLIGQCRNLLFKTFGLNQQNYHLFFHSGASEGINTLIKGMAESFKRKKEVIHFFHLVTDHSCVVNCAKDLIENGHPVTSISVDSNGVPDWDSLEKDLLQVKGPKLINLTWVNNESGVVLDLKKIKELKEKTGAFVHIDAVQAVGKIENFTGLQDLDAYTFSGHKFGAMKGVGFSFFKKDFPFLPFVRGGGQQEGLRSGTENTTGIWSIKLALEDLLQKFDYCELEKNKQIIEKNIMDTLGDNGLVVGNHTKRNGNTIYFIHKKAKAQDMAMAFDLAGIDVSNGSACSSGAVVPSRVLLGMGFSEQQAKSAIRLSFSPYLKKSEAEEFSKVISDVLKRFN